MNDEASCPVLWIGQEPCHDGPGRVVACTGSGQDAENRRGRIWPELRFEMQGDTVQDRLTGLMWSRDTSPAEYLYPAGGTVAVGV